MARRITVLDLGSSGAASVRCALLHVGAGVGITTDPDAVASSRMIVLSARGRIAPAMTALRDGAVGAALQLVIRRGDPVLAIGLGMQLLFEGSDEAPGRDGLAVFSGHCRRFSDHVADAPAGEMTPGAGTRSRTWAGTAWSRRECTTVSRTATTRCRSAPTTCCGLRSVASTRAPAISPRAALRSRRRTSVAHAGAARVLPLRIASLGRWR